MIRLAGTLEGFGRLGQGMKEAYGEGREDNRVAFKRSREDQGYEPEDVRLGMSLGQNRTWQMLKGLVPRFRNQALEEVYEDMGMGLSSDPWTRTGQVLGHLGADLTQDRSRELWWLLNAPQAIGNVATEAAVQRANPGIYRKVEDLGVDSMGNPITMKSPEARQLGAVSEQTGRLKKGYTYREDLDGNKIVQKRLVDPGHAYALQIPAGFALNSGIGLMNPFGGQEGYQAAIPSDEDPNKTANPVAEIAAKYILGRTGNILQVSSRKYVLTSVRIVHGTRHLSSTKTVTSTRLMMDR